MGWKVIILILFASAATALAQWNYKDLAFVSSATRRASGNTGSWQTNNFTTTSNGWSWPSGVTGLVAQAWGGGGGGGGASGNPSTGGGGRGGGYAEGNVANVGSTTIDILVGTNGLAGASGAGTGGTGGPSGIRRSSTNIVLATAGVGGAGQSGNSANGAGATTSFGTAAGTTTFNGGNGSTGAFASGSGFSGAGGGAAGTTGAGGAASSGTGGTGTADKPTSDTGNGANGVGDNTAGASGTIYGGGGSGGKANSNPNVAGGAGAQGYVRIRYFLPPFSGQTITDDFNRANGGDIGANWTPVTSETAMQILSNQIQPQSAGADCGERYSGVTWAANQSSECAVTVTGGTAGTGGGVLVRCASGARTYFRLVVDDAGHWEVGRTVSGTFTSLATGTTTYSAGAKIKLTATGTSPSIQLTSVYNGSQLNSQTVNVGSTALDSGSPGISYSSATTTCILDDWTGIDGI